MIGNDFVIVGGFANGISAATTNVYSLDMSNPNANWQEMDDLPISKGVSHGAYVVVGSKFYMCGGVRLNLAVVCCTLSESLTTNFVLNCSLAPYSTWVAILDLPLMTVLSMTTPNHQDLDNGAYFPSFQKTVLVEA